MRKNLLVGILILCSFYLHAATDMPSQEDWVQKMSSFLKGDYEFYDSVTLEHLQTELKEVPIPSQKWVETIMSREEKLLGGSWAGKSHDLWTKASVSRLLGSINPESRDWFSRMVMHPDPGSSHFRAEFIQSLTEVSIAKQPWVETIFCSFVDPEVLNPCKIIRELIFIDFADYNWVQTMIEHHFSSNKIWGEGIISILGYITFNRPWVESRAQDLISFDDENMRDRYIRDIFASLKAAASQTEVFERRLAKYLSPDLDTYGKVTVIRLASHFMEISDDLYDQVVTCLLPPDCPQKVKARVWALLLECSNSQINYEQLIACSKNLKPYDDDSYEDYQKFKGIILDCWVGHVDKRLEKNPMFE